NPPELTAGSMVALISSSVSGTAVADDVDPGRGRIADLVPVAGLDDDLDVPLLRAGPAPVDHADDLGRRRLTGGEGDLASERFVVATGPGVTTSEERRR